MPLAHTSPQLTRGTFFVDASRLAAPFGSDVPETESSTRRARAARAGRAARFREFLPNNNFTTKPLFTLQMNIPIVSLKVSEGWCRAGVAAPILLKEISAEIPLLTCTLVVKALEGRCGGGQRRSGFVGINLLKWSATTPRAGEAENDDFHDFIGSRDVADRERAADPPGRPSGPYTNINSGFLLSVHTRTHTHYTCTRSPTRVYACRITLASHFYDR
ncbi:hypothetical protein EVAR_51533_1 [Eumeta japonica]|uniref:Uncharacterized protein n=1 Tax=Eumeta variegata TaxID=151549 RepID=A0A4C1XD03_EUMVA|nr:hypothetical protein EVAR_51533_1 [Eumeta japonica]